MKNLKRYIACFILFFSLFEAKAQATWDFNNTAWSIDVNDGFGGSYLQYLQSDTDVIINSISYKKINNFALLVRSDNRKVFGIDINDTTQEFLLFDFNANVGTMVTNIAVSDEPSTFGYQFNDFYVIDKDSFSINNIYYNIIHVGVFSSDSTFFNDNSYWYENIGCASGLFEHVVGGMHNSSLSCYTKNDTGIYVSNINRTNFPWNHPAFNGAAIQVFPGGCTTIGITENNYMGSSTFNIAPNPNNGAFKISITKSNKPIGIKEIKVVDMMGKVIWKTGASANNVFDVDITKYSQGIYYVRSINEQGEIEVQKLVKQ